MKMCTKSRIAFAAIVLALIVSPAVPYSEAGKTMNIASSMENYSKKSITKTIVIIGDEKSQFLPSIVHLKVGDTVRFINQDGTNGGMAHQIISVDEHGMPNGKFKASFHNPGDTYFEKFAEPGTYNYIDSTYPHMKGTIVVS